MKVLQLISGGDTGGAKTHVFALLSSLYKKVDVKIVCFMKGVFYDELSVMPVQSELIEQKSRFDMSVLDRLCEILAEGYDLVHCHGARANFIGWQLKQRGISLPFVTTIHSDYLLDFDSFYKKVVYTSLNVMALKRFDHYIAVSSNFKDMLIDRGFRPNAIHTVYNGMDYTGDPCYSSKEEFAGRIGITYDPNCTYIGILGRHDYVKGQDVFINAAKLVCDAEPNVRFIIAGEGEGRAELVALCEKLGISDHVIFCGFVKDVYSCYNFIDINTLTSRCESFPYVLLEGARMKKPTVSSRVGGIPDLIIDGKTGLLFESENYHELADKLLLLIRDKALAARYGEALYDHATSHFSNESLADTHVSIYNAILEDHTSDKTYDVTMSGYYGFHNCGDDALLHAIIRDLREEMPSIRIHVLSARPKDTRRVYRVDSDFRFSPLALRRVMRGSRMLINGGGSLIQDATSSQSLWYYLSVMKYAKKCGCKLFIYANGIGPVSEKNRKRAALVANAADCITLREEGSLDELRRMNVSSPTIRVTADPAISLVGCGAERVNEIFLAESVPKNKHRYIGVSVREWQNNDPRFYQKIAEALDEAASKFDAAVVMLPMKLPDDVRASEKLSSFMKTSCTILRSSYDYTDMIGVISRMDLIVGMRLHTLIFSLGAAVPSIGIVYDPKIRSFLDYVGIDRMIEADKVDVSLLLSKIYEVLGDTERLKTDLIEQRERLSALAKSNAAEAIRVLNGDTDQ